MKYIIILFALLPFTALAQGTASPTSEAEIRLDPKSPAYDPEIAFQLFKGAAEAGDKRAMVFLGQLYSKGLGAPKDGAKAIEWFSKAATGDAWYNLGQLYKDGAVVPQDFIKAFGYYQKAREMKSANGYYSEGFMRYKGLGCEQDYAEAFRLFQTGIRKGSISSMYMAGLCYRNGYGTAVKLDSARHWLQQAASKGYRPAIDEMQAKDPENPDALTANSNSRTAKPKARAAIAKVKHTAKPSDLVGTYTGYAIQYDWSGQHIIGKSRLELTVENNKNKLSGTWAEEGKPVIAISAQLTDTALLFSNTSYQHADHYSAGKAVAFEFRGASLQIAKQADSVYLAGNISLWATELNEPEKPVYITLSRSSVKPGKKNDHAFAENTLMPKADDAGLIVVYPNPFADALQVSFYMDKAGKAELQLVDMSGRTAKKMSVQLQQGRQLQSLDATGVAAGAYILKLSANGSVKSTLVIKQ